MSATARTMRSYTARSGVVSQLNPVRGNGCCRTAEEELPRASAAANAPSARRSDGANRWMRGGGQVGGADVEIEGSRRLRDGRSRVTGKGWGPVENS